MDKVRKFTMEELYYAIKSGDYNHFKRALFYITDTMQVRLWYTGEGDGADTKIEILGVTKPEPYPVIIKLLSAFGADFVFNKEVREKMEVMARGCMINGEVIDSMEKAVKWSLKNLLNSMKSSGVNNILMRSWREIDRLHKGE